MFCRGPFLLLTNIVVLITSGFTGPTKPAYVPIFSKISGDAA